MKITCLCCYIEFVIEDKVTAFCSYVCYQNWTSNLCFPSNCNTKFYNKKRRQKVLSGDNINRILLAEDYNWICQLCFSDIHPNRKFPDVMSSTVDHIIPISKGGLHKFENVQPAHLKCNIDKGNTYAAGTKNIR